VPNDDDRLTFLVQERLGRLERRLRALEERLDETAARLEVAVDVTIRVTRLVAVLNTNLRTNHRRHRKRMDRLAATVIAGRTADAERIAQLARRLASLEARGA
jgi:hypothetical protein